MRKADPIVPDRSVVIFLSEIDDLPCKTESLLSSFQITDGLRSKISKIGIHVQKERSEAAQPEARGEALSARKVQR